MFHLRHFPYLCGMSYLPSRLYSRHKCFIQDFPFEQKSHSLSPASGHSSLPSNSASQCVRPGKKTKMISKRASISSPCKPCLKASFLKGSFLIQTTLRLRKTTISDESCRQLCKWRQTLFQWRTTFNGRNQTLCQRYWSCIYKNPFHVPSWHSLKSGHRHVYLWEPFSCPLWHSLNSGHRHVYLWEPFSCPILTLSEIRK